MLTTKLRCLMIGGSLFPMAVHAQPILNDIGDLLIGMEISYLKVQPQTLVAGPSGANATWDFSALGTSTDTLTQTIAPLDSSEYGNMFEEATLVELNSNGSQAFIQRGTVDRIVGYITTEGIVIRYPDPHDFLRRPFTYNDSLADTSTRSYYLNENEIVGSGTTLTYSDAWGTLIMPNGTFSDVLRLRFDQSYTDIDQTNGLIIEAVTRSYRWFDPLHRSALLKIDSTFINSMFFTDTVTSVSYLLHETPVAINEIPGSIDMYFNGNEILLAADLSAGEEVRLRVFDASGKLIQEEQHRIPANGRHYAIPFRGVKKDQVLFIQVSITGTVAPRIGTIKIIY